MYLTSTVGRGGIKYFTPREGIKISFPRAEGARGRNFSTFTRGEVFIPPRPTVEVRHSCTVQICMKFENNVTLIKTLFKDVFP